MSGKMRKICKKLVEGKQKKVQFVHVIFHCSNQESATFAGDIWENLHQNEEILEDSADNSRRSRVLAHVTR